MEDKEEAATQRLTLRRGWVGKRYVKMVTLQAAYFLLLHLSLHLLHLPRNAEVRNDIGMR